MAIEIRHATAADVDDLTAVEAACFPPAEAASRESIAARVSRFGDHFWLLFEDGRLVSFVDGMVTNQPDLTDDLYGDADRHDENGAWQMIFGVNTVPARRRHGFAARLIERAVSDARAQGRRGLVLTCKDHMVSYYARFGFVDEGVTEKSTHGGAVWRQMRATF